MTTLPKRVASLLSGALLLVLLVACETRSPTPTFSGPAVPPAPDSQPPTDTGEVLKVLAKSAHAAVDCAECHVPAEGQAPPAPGTEQKIAKARCEHCHEREAEAFATSTHGKAAARGVAGAPRCANCHGTHEIRKVEDPDSRVYKRRLVETCGACHQNPDVARKLGIRDPFAAGNYLDSVHGRALVGSGLVVAPSCVDCHGHSHHILAKSEPGSQVNRAHVAKTCGQCHEGIEQKYGNSIHGAKLAAGDPKAPVCIDCHTAHSVASPEKRFRLDIDALCGRCHQERLKQYETTYHGEANHLGESAVAACYDCHGSHEIRRVSDPGSTLSQANRLSTCRRCHTAAGPKFASYFAHADHDDRERYPLLYWTYMSMQLLLFGTFGFFGVHTILWFGRTALVYARDPAGFRERRRAARPRPDSRYFERFSPVDRLCHILVIVSFLTLVATGMPLKFSQEQWAQPLLAFLGGVAAAGLWHRLAAIVTFSYFALHIGRITLTVWRNRPLFRDEAGRFRVRRFLAFAFGPDSPMPNFQDLRDIVAHVRWFLGLGPRPRFDRFTYWEKFDYMAVFWGVTVIGLSGLVMWFAEPASPILPGWMVNVAQVIHSDEALLAAGFIFTFHFFNSHFRPEKFPMDTVIFSGRLTEEELRHEHGRQYERMQASGTLEPMAPRPPYDAWSDWRWLFGTFGALALLIGLILIVAIFWALIGHGLLG